MFRLLFPEPLGTLRLGSGFFLSAIVAGILVAVGRPMGAAGVGIGFTLYAINVFFLYETARSLLSRSDPGGPRFLAAASSVGRLLFLGTVLTLVFFLLGREALIGGCGGLFLSQVNLHLQRGRPEGAI